MGGSKPVFTPYPTFQTTCSNPSNTGVHLSTIGKCRIYPLNCCNKLQQVQNNNNSMSPEEEYNSILEKTIQQSQVPDDDDEENKKLKKKYMKQSVAMAQSYLTSTLGLDTSVIDVEIVIHAESVVKSDGCIVSCFLDAGCDKIVIISTDNGNDSGNGNGNTDEDNLILVQALDVARVPKERLVAHIGKNENHNDQQQQQQQFIASILPLTNNITTTMSESKSQDAQACIATIQSIANVANTEDGGDDAINVVLEFPTSDTHTEESTKQMGIVVSTILNHCSTSKDKSLASPSTTITLIDPDPNQLGRIYAACIVTDRPDKLYTTVVCTRAGEALGLVYSSIGSIVAALECGRGVYYSRSRNGLWRKGDTSGHFQTLHRIDVDCDGDALRFMVTQRTTGDDDGTAAFCHLHTLTCWGEPHGVRHLEQTLQTRLRNAPQGSYTKRLFDDSDLLRDKLVEEAQELSEADTKQHVAEELADVLYFAMTKAVKAGISIDDAIAELDKRTRKVTRRKGDSKAFRIAAGDAILNKDNKKEKE